MDGEIEKFTLTRSYWVSGEDIWLKYERPQPKPSSTITDGKRKHTKRKAKRKKRK